MSIKRAVVKRISIACDGHMVRKELSIKLAEPDRVLNKSSRSDDVSEQVEHIESIFGATRCHPVRLTPLPRPRSHSQGDRDSIPQYQNGIFQRHWRHVFCSGVA